MTHDPAEAERLCALAAAQRHRGALETLRVSFADRAGNEETLTSAIFPGVARILWNEDTACAMPNLGGHRRARLAHRSSMTGECTTARGRSGTVMRHLLPVRAFTPPAPVTALTLGMTVSTTSRALIPPSRRTQRFTPSEVAAAGPAIPLAPITARADEHLAPASGTQKQSGIVHRSPRRGGLDDPRSPGNTALGAVRKCGSGRSLGPDRQVNSVRGCVDLLADSDLTRTRKRRHRRCTRRRRPMRANLSSGGEQRHAPGGDAGSIPGRSALFRQSQLTKAVRQIPALLRSRQQVWLVSFSIGTVWSGNRKIGCSRGSPVSQEPATDVLREVPRQA